MRVAHGPRALEALLVADLASEMERVRADPALLGRPIRIVVPSRSLRDHLGAALPRALGRSLAGVSLLTLRGLALFVLERGEEIDIGSAVLFEIFVQREAAREPDLMRELGHLDDPWPSVCATLRDLFDAGFESAHEEPLLEALARGGDGAAATHTGRAWERARALVRVAARVAEGLARSSAGPPAHAQQRAAQLLSERDDLLSARAVWIHGFADATGVGVDLLGALQRRAGAHVYYDTAYAATSTALSFGQRLRECLGIDRFEVTRTPFATPHLYRANGAEAEVREAARRIRAALDRGARPESIAIVARDLDPYRLAIRRHLARLSIPFSGIGARGTSGAAARHVGAVLHLLQERGEAAIDRWLGARADLPGAERSELRVVARAVGAARLSAVAELDLNRLLGRRTELALSLRGGASEEDFGEAPESELEPSSPKEKKLVLARRTISRERLAALREGARALLATLGTSPQLATSARQAESVRALLAQLSWSTETAGAEAIESALLDLEMALPAPVEITREEFARALASAAEVRVATLLGGAGGGVQCLSVLEARARTFDRVFVLGLNQGVFPRNVREDPLLSDRLRHSMRAVLPDMPIKSLGHGEERALFEQLALASPNVTLSWQIADDEDKARIVSPFIDAFLPGCDPGNVDPAPPVMPLVEVPDEVRPAHEKAVLLALRGARAAPAGAVRSTLEPALEVALEDVRARAGLSTPIPQGAAKARSAVIAELDRGPSSPTDLGPYFGFIGPMQSGASADLRRGDLFVTTFERLAGCAWQTFLQKVLRLESLADPLEALPAIGPHSVGRVVHAVLQRVVEGAHEKRESRALADVRRRTPVPIHWPAKDEVERLALAAAREVLRDDGILFPGLEHLLVEQARPFLDVAREFDAHEAAQPGGALGAEVSGEIPIDAQRSLRFVADRVESRAGGLVLTDFKTGKPISAAVRATTRAKHFIQDVARGKLLQASAYYLAGGSKGEGRYVFLGPDLAHEARIFGVGLETHELHQAFEIASTGLSTAWMEGAFFPRLVQDDLLRENEMCARCDVAQACLRGDSGARSRFERWVTAQADEKTRATSPAEISLLRVWSLGRDFTPEGAEEETE